MPFDPQTLSLIAEGSPLEISKELEGVEAYDRASESRLGVFAKGAQGLIVIGAVTVFVGTELAEQVLGTARGLLFVVLALGVVGVGVFMKRNLNRLAGTNLVDDRYRLVQDLVPEIPLKPDSVVYLELYPTLEVERWLTLRGRDRSGHGFVLKAEGGSPTKLTLSLKRHLDETGEEVCLSSVEPGSGLAAAARALLREAQEKLNGSG